MPELIQKIILKSSHGAAIFLSKKHKQDILELEKYAQIGKISSGILHDLISPITALTMQIELLEEKKGEDKLFINSMKQASNKIVEFSKLMKTYLSGNTEKSLIDLGETIEDAIKLISYKAIIKGIQIQFIRKNGIMIKTNKIQIYQIVISLLSNAIESYRDSDKNRKIILKLERIKNKIIFSITDFGCGISDTKKIFKTFYTTKKDTGGTGIGLSSVKHLIEKELKGKLVVKSKIGKGSTFKIII